MKIKVNYDLMDKIRENKIGISLKKTVNKTTLYTSIYTIFSIPNIYVSYEPLVELFETFARGEIVYSSIVIFAQLLVARSYKKVTNYELKELARILREHHINTDYELLQKAYEYETKYSFMLDEEKIPRLKQEKYIMVPVVDRDGEKEVSLVQEHLIGSKDYELSYGSPTKAKVLKPVYNGI